MSRAVPRCLALIVAATFGGGAGVGAELLVAAEGFERLDGAESLAAFTGADRLSQAIIRRAGAETGLPPALLDDAVVEVLRGADGAARLCEDLNRGDDQLLALLRTTLAAYNLPAAEADVLIERWARQGPDRELAAILGETTRGAEERARLRPYFLAASRREAAVVINTHRLVTGPGDGAAALVPALVNAAGMDEEGARAAVREAGISPAGRWTLLPLIRRVVARGGALGRALQQPASDAAPPLRELVWQRVARSIAADPRLLQAYAREIGNADEIGGLVEEFLLASLAPDGPDRMAEGLGSGASRPRSREALAFLAVVPRAQFPAAYLEGSATPAGAGLRLFPGALAKAARASGAWRRWLLWYLTRPAEVNALGLRAALPSVLARDSRLARAMIAASPIFNAEFDGRVAAAGGYGDSASPADLRREVADTSVRDEALKRYGRAAAVVLASDDQSWEDAIRGAERFPAGIVATLLAESVRNDPSVATGWLRTCTRNDAVLGNGFGAWLVTAGEAPNHRTAVTWLTALDRSVEHDVVVGSADFARFKELFLRYAATEAGWANVWTRLALESFALPGALRRQLIDAAVAQPATFWALQGRLITLPGPGVATMKARTLMALGSSRLGEMALDEIALRNPIAADAAAPVLDALTRPGSAAMSRFEAAMGAGAVRTSVFVFGVRSLHDALTDPDLWREVSDSGRRHLGADGPAQLPRVMMGDRTAALRFVQDALAVPAIRSAWRERIREGVLSGGFADAFAAFLKGDAELTAAWRSEVYRAVGSTPDLCGLLVQSLHARRTGDAGWTAEVAAQVRIFAEIVFGDRVFFEQMLASPGGAFREVLRPLAEPVLGTYRPETW